MNSNKCKATTKKGLPCNNHAMKSSQYCYVHSFTHFKKVPFHKNGIFHVLVLLIIPLTIFVIQWHQGEQTKSAIIGEIRTQMQDYDKQNYPELIKSYPLGYVYLAYNHKHGSTTTLDRTVPSLNYLIRANTMKVTPLSLEQILVRVPDLAHKPTGNVFSGNDVVFSRKIGKSQRVPFGTPGVRMWFELLIDARERLICLIGFREEKPTNE